MNFVVIREKFMFHVLFLLFNLGLIFYVVYLIHRSDKKTFKAALTKAKTDPKTNSITIGENTPLLQYLIPYSINHATKQYWY